MGAGGEIVGRKMPAGTPALLGGRRYLGVVV
jgi:hypothetical protein